jgi:phage tail tape-measure protein
MAFKKKNKVVSKKTDHGRVVHEAEGTGLGALAGAAIGAAAGPPGIVAGAIIGGLAGAATGAALDSESTRQRDHDRDLDKQIGVTDEELGAPNLKHPPAKIGAYSVASTGGGSSPPAQPAEGPMQTPEK